MHDVTVARLQSTRVQTPLSPLFKMYGNVLRESLSVDSQNIPCATLKRRGSWIISVNLCISLFGPDLQQSRCFAGRRMWCESWTRPTWASPTETVPSFVLLPQVQYSCSVAMAFRTDTLRHRQLGTTACLACWAMGTNELKYCTVRKYILYWAV